MLFFCDLLNIEIESMKIGRIWKKMGKNNKMKVVKTRVFVVGYYKQATDRQKIGPKAAKTWLFLSKAGKVTTIHVQEDVNYQRYLCNNCEFRLKIILLPFFLKFKI